jgi:hypothetical protein
MRPGVASLLARPLPRQAHMTSLCEYFYTITHISLHLLNITIIYLVADRLVLRSANVTVSNSAGYVQRSHELYSSLPPDSRKPPAPIDPSSTYHGFCTRIYRTHAAYSQQVVPYLVRLGLKHYARLFFVLQLRIQPN